MSPGEPEPPRTKAIFRPTAQGREEVVEMACVLPILQDASTSPSSRSPV